MALLLVMEQIYETSRLLYHIINNKNTSGLFLILIKNLYFQFAA